MFVWKSICFVGMVRRGRTYLFDLFRIDIGVGCFSFIVAGGVFRGYNFERSCLVGFWIVLR